ncbi:MAG: hypothetical protein O3B70_00315 [Bacteroidetes bacterium]|nr:hypothetical protein [Bacteroidota bacterium]MDA0902758.1 hypothetical protein [Bacteroidota bacterium]MDA1242895.1 hypothetical protein [Bacteroidota bacterium]
MNQETRGLNFYWFLIVVVTGSVFSQGCRRQMWDTNPNHVLRFSTMDADGVEDDTMFFDTVFTTVGSVTLPLKVYNDHAGTLLIDEIGLERGSASEFRVNVNGMPLTSSGLRDIALEGGDSLFVFVEVTVNPNLGAGNIPFLISDFLRFSTNGVEQQVGLLAKGQNAVFHGGPEAYTFLECDEIWDSSLPHVMYGRLIVDEGCTLTLLPGTQVFGHDGSGLWVRGGTLRAEGELGNPVVFRGDRLENAYQDSPGQWGLSFEVTDTLSGNLVNYSAFRGGIWLDRAVDCRLDHVEIHDATVALWVDSVGTSSEVALTLSNSLIRNAESIGILSQSGHIKGFNNLIINCGQACGYFALGGDIQMHLTTFANFSSLGGIRQFPTVYFNDWYEAFDGSIQWRPFSEGTEFRNCIVWGNNVGLNDFSEFVPDLWDSEIYASPLWTHSAIHHQWDEFPETILDEFTSVDLEPPFVGVLNEDFHLDGNAPAWLGASSSPPFTLFEVSSDLEGNPRSSISPTKGCFERLP